LNTQKQQIRRKAMEDTQMIEKVAHLEEREK
jgi:hypothetical protein